MPTVSSITNKQDSAVGVAIFWRMQREEIPTLWEKETECALLQGLITECELRGRTGSDRRL